jgi:hypothetical protein
MVTTSGRPHACLYRGPLDPSLEAAAPWLVELAPDAAFTRLLLGQMWGKSWGVFVDAASPLDQVQRQLRGFLKVKDEKGRQLLFRWYDPRVLRPYLPTTTPDEARKLCGPLLRYLCESEDGDALLSWAYAKDGFVHERLDIPEGDDA